MIRRVTLALALLVCGVPAFAQQRPLQTEDPETIGAGRILVEAGIDYKRDVYLPVSGLRGNLFTVPPFGLSVGISSIAEIQIDAGLYQKLYITEQVPNAPFSNLLDLDAGSTADVEDINIGAKVRVLAENQHADVADDANRLDGLAEDHRAIEVLHVFPKAFFV